MMDRQLHQTFIYEEKNEYFPEVQQSDAGNNSESYIQPLNAGNESEGCNQAFDAGNGSESCNQPQSAEKGSDNCNRLQNAGKDNGNNNVGKILSKQSTHNLQRTKKQVAASASVMSHNEKIIQTGFAMNSSQVSHGLKSDSKQSDYEQKPKYPYFSRKYRPVNPVLNEEVELPHFNAKVFDGLKEERNQTGLKNRDKFRSSNYRINHPQQPIIRPIQEYPKQAKTRVPHRSAHQIKGVKMGSQMAQTHFNHRQAKHRFLQPGTPTEQYHQSAKNAQIYPVQITSAQKDDDIDRKEQINPKQSKRFRIGSSSVATKNFDYSVQAEDCDKQYQKVVEKIELSPVGKEGKHGSALVQIGREVIEYKDVNEAYNSEESQQEKGSKEVIVEEREGSRSKEQGPIVHFEKALQNRDHPDLRRSNDAIQCASDHRHQQIVVKQQDQQEQAKAELSHPKQATQCSKPEQAQFMEIKHEQLKDQIEHQQSKEEHKLQKQELQEIESAADVSTFNLIQYAQIYPVLNNIKLALKASIINVQQILRCIKRYLQIIANGNLDNIDNFHLPLNKKKNVKIALFYERVAMIILSFAYATLKIKDARSYLLNIVGFSLNNCLILIKVLESTQISDSHKDGDQLESRPQSQSDTVSAAIKQSNRASTKNNLETLRNNNEVIWNTIQKITKSDQIFYENLMKIMKLINKSSLSQSFYHLLEYFSFYLSVGELGRMIPFLAVAPNPYLSPTASNNKYTLVIDVLEVFCHGTKRSKQYIYRPYSQHFLHQMNQFFDLVAFTPVFPHQIDKVIDLLDPKGFIKHRLYRHHTIYKDKVALKFVERIGRDTDEIVLLDNQSQGGRGSISNCIHVPAWKGSKNDTILAQICPLLAMIALKRKGTMAAISKVRQQVIKNRQEGVKYINYGINLD